MKLGIFIQHYFPYGGLQRDAVRLAQAALKAGHAPVMTVSTWDGDIPTDFPLNLLNSGGQSNHSKAARFAHASQAHYTSENYDTAIGFSRVPDLPFHFCGDPCFLDKFTRNKPSLARLLPRYRHLIKNENSLFGRDSSTHIFFLAASEILAYQNHYPLPPEQYSLLPPWLNTPTTFEIPLPEVKNNCTSELSIPQDSRLLLFVGSDYHRKGLDRAIKALAALQSPNTHLIVCGQYNPTAYTKLASELAVGNQLHILGPRDDIPRWMASADALLHPARQETAGMVLLEALTYGLPVICTRHCGYASHVADAGGILLATSPTTEDLTAAITSTFKHHTSHQKQARQWAGDPIRPNAATLMLEKMQSSPR